MQEYVADKQVASGCAAKRRRGMLVHKVGWPCWSFAVRHAGGRRRPGAPGRRLFARGACADGGGFFFFCLVAALGAAAMLGPGRELLMTRPWEACRFTQDAFELEYRPRPHTEEKDYERVMYRMLYADIRRVEYDSSCERLLVFGRAHRGPLLHRKRQTVCRYHRHHRCAAVRVSLLRGL